MSNSTQKAVTARITTIFKNHPVGSQDLEPAENRALKTLAVPRQPPDNPAR
jgi:hypothetical protein